MIRRPPRSTLFPYNDALPISGPGEKLSFLKAFSLDGEKVLCSLKTQEGLALGTEEGSLWLWRGEGELLQKVSLPGQPALGHLSSNHQGQLFADRKSTRLNSSHVRISYA